MGHPWYPAPMSSGMEAADAVVDRCPWGCGPCCRGSPAVSSLGKRGAGCPPRGKVAPATSPSLDFAPRLFSIACNHQTQQKRSPGRGAGGGEKLGAALLAASLLPPSPTPGPPGWDVRVGVSLSNREQWGGGAETRLHSSHVSRRRRRRRAASLVCLSIWAAPTRPGFLE